MERIDGMLLAPLWKGNNNINMMRNQDEREEGRVSKTVRLLPLGEASKVQGGPNTSCCDLDSKILGLRDYITLRISYSGILVLQDSRTLGLQDYITLGI